MVFDAGQVSCAENGDEVLRMAGTAPPHVTENRDWQGVLRFPTQGGFGDPTGGGAVSTGAGTVNGRS